MTVISEGVLEIMNKEIIFKLDSYITLEDKYLEVIAKTASGTRLNALKTLDETCIFFFIFLKENTCYRLTTGTTFK